MSIRSGEKDVKSWLNLKLEDDLDEELDDSRIPSELRALLDVRKKGVSGQAATAGATGWTRDNNRPKKRIMAVSWTGLYWGR